MRRRRIMIHAGIMRLRQLELRHEERDGDDWVDSDESFHTPNISSLWSMQTSYGTIPECNII